MAEQFLDCSEIPAGFKQVGREGVTQGMGCSAGRQAELRAGLGHDGLDRTWGERAAAHAAE